MTSTGSPRSALPSTNGGWYWFAEIGCLGLGLALAVSTVRLFSEKPPILVLAGVAVAAWALALAIRRSPIPPGVGELLHLAIGVVTLLVVTAPEARFGPLPTVGSLRTLTEMLQQDFGAFNEDIAPLDPRKGHMVVLSALVWGLALFCSTTAMRLRAPVQAAVPHLVAIVALGLVARQQGRTETSVVLVVAVCTYALAQVSWRNAAFRWLPVGRSTVARTFGAGAVILGIAGLLTALVAPLSPVTDDPALDLRRGGAGNGGPRTVVSPFVEVGSYLGARSDDLLFTVGSPRPGYWRLTGLDTYDVDDAIWVLSNSYTPVRGPLSSEAEADTYAAEVAIEALGGIWVPAPQSPVEAEAAFDLGWDSSSTSLISRDDDLTAGDRVDFAAATTDVTAADLADATAASGPPVLLDDSGAPAELVAAADELTAGLDDFESALALQGFFREGFEYDETVNYSGEDDPLSAFLDARSGFCQQFSTAFALAARSVGLPTRVVVGFTSGDVSTTDEGATYAVWGRNAHAWPEVLFEGAGWVPFEPTPGRGDPSSTAITGVPAQQAEPPEQPISPSVPETTPVPADTTPATDAPSGAGGSPPPEPGQVPDTKPNASEATVPWSWVAVLVVAAGSIAAIVLARRRSASRRRATASDPVQDSWRLALSELETHGLRPDPNETPVEFACRVVDSVDTPSLVEIAILESARRWSPEPTSERDGEAARAAYRNLSAELDPRTEDTGDEDRQLVSG